MRTTPILLTGLLIALSLNLQAEEHTHGHASAHDHHDGHDHSASLGAHEHGVGSLNLVIDGHAVAIELDSPADNLLGFEYMPTSDADLSKTREIMTRLEQADSLFAFPTAAGCQLDKVELESAQFDAAKQANNAHDAHHHASHEHEHEHNEHKQADAHADISAQFHFLCSQPAALNQIEVILFEAFPGTETLLLQAITPAGQQGGELSATQNIIRF
ncbi:MAG: DUF2796 domain-containing protein [Gammaproteobacteria bacterium HGW-Gammaproteobacteria-11]|nr:MAG: DUF2796 domain-containing protein [Gammaproteobacteria bacterium HGW-Gammaproteobacteria-11]